MSYDRAKIVTVAALITCFAMSLSTQAHAGFGFKPPKISRPKLPKPVGPGQYQRKMAAGIAAGASAGYEVAGYPGALVGASAGAGYADHQHHANKVHNYRTVRNIRIRNDWYHPVTFEVLTPRGWTKQWMAPRESRHFRGPIQVRFANGVGAMRNVNMKSGTFTFHAQNNGVELAW